MVRVFLAGIIQGSIAEKRIHSQDYRFRVIDALECLPDAEVLDPISDHPNSLEYSARKSRDVFFELMRRAGEIDVLVAFVPEASMGTAIEMWEAWRSGALVVAITPMAVNWSIRFLTHRVYTTLEEFEAAASNGEFRQLVEEHLDARVPRSTVLGWPCSTPKLRLNVPPTSSGSSKASETSKQ